MPLGTCPAQPSPAPSQGILAVLSEVGHSFPSLLPQETAGVQGLSCHKSMFLAKTGLHKKFLGSPMQDIAKIPEEEQY